MTQSERYAKAIKEYEEDCFDNHMTVLDFDWLTVTDMVTNLLYCAENVPVTPTFKLLAEVPKKMTVCRATFPDGSTLLLTIEPTEGYSDRVHVSITTDEHLTEFSGRLAWLIENTRMDYRSVRTVLARRQGEYVRVTTQDEGFKGVPQVQYMTEDRFLSWFRDGWENKYDDPYGEPQTAEQVLKRIKAYDWEIVQGQWGTWLNVEWIGEES